MTICLCHVGMCETSIRCAWPPTPCYPPPHIVTRRTITVTQDCVGKDCLWYVEFGAQFWGISEDKWVPKGLLPPVAAKPPTKRAKPRPKGAAQSIPVHSGDHVPEFKVQWSRTKERHIVHPRVPFVTLPAGGTREHFSCAVHICPHLPLYFSVISVHTNACAQW